MTFIVSTPAADRNLLTLSEIKSALGITTSDRDSELLALGGYVSDLISHECCVPDDGTHIATLLSEGITETIRVGKREPSLSLSRRFISAISSVTVDGSALSAGEYEIDKSSGLLFRLSYDARINWDAGVIVVIYTAGFSSIPGALTLAATTVLREQWSAGSRDPLMRRERVDGIGEQEFWVNSSTGSASASPVSGVAARMLDAYRYHAV